MQFLNKVKNYHNDLNLNEQELEKFKKLFKFWDKILLERPNLPIPFSTVLAIQTYFSPLVILLTAACITPGRVNAE